MGSVLDYTLKLLAHLWLNTELAMELAVDEDVQQGSSTLLVEMGTRACNLVAAAAAAAELLAEQTLAAWVQLQHHQIYILVGVVGSPRLRGEHSVDSVPDYTYKAFSDQQTNNVSFTVCSL